MKSFEPLQYDSKGGSSRTRGINCAGWLPAGITVSSAVFTIKGTGLTFSTPAVNGSIITSLITASQTGRFEINIKIILSNSEVEYRSVDLKVYSRKSL